jgi:hypothetical protein
MRRRDLDNEGREQVGSNADAKPRLLYCLFLPASGLRSHGREAGDIAARPGRAFDEARLNRIGGAGKHDGYRKGFIAQRALK